MKSNKRASRCTQRTLEHSDGTPRGTSRAIQEQLGTQGNQSLEGNLVTRALKALGQLGTQALDHLGTRRTLGDSRYSKALHLADSIITQITILFFKNLPR